MYNGRYTRESLKSRGTILSEMVIEGEAVSGNVGSAHIHQTQDRKIEKTSFRSKLVLSYILTSCTE